MLLVLDIGNSNIVGCICRDGFSDHSCSEWLEVMRVKTEDKKSYSDCLIDMNYNLSEYFELVDVIVMSSVVPNLNSVYIQLCKELFGIEPFIINHKLYSMLPIEIPQPHIIGSDIVANAIYGYDKAPEGCVIVDFGTTLTFTTVYDKKIAGVTFVPGVKTAVNVLFEKTAQLPKVKLNPPQSVIGRDTCAAINGGVFFGYGGLVDRVVLTIEKEIGIQMKLFATGGMGSLLLPYCESKFEYDIHLTVNGMKKIYEITK